MSTLYENALMGGMMTLKDNEEDEWDVVGDDDLTLGDDGEELAVPLDAYAQVVRALSRTASQGGGITIKSMDQNAGTIVLSTGEAQSVIVSVVGFEGQPDSAGARHRMSRKSTDPGDIERWSSDQS